VIDVDAKMVVTARDGKRYRLVPVEE